MLILNEEKYAKDLYDGKNHEVKSIMARIRYITRYLIHSEQKTNDETYKETVKWLREHHNNFDESSYSNVISDAIKSAFKYPFYIIDNIKITRSELETISSLDSLRAEKILFVLLCMAKQQSMSNGFTNGLVKYSITDLCKMARVSVPADDREYVLYEIVQRGLLGYPKKNNTQCLIVNFINTDEVVLELDEMDCQELAYAYLNWKNDGKGYTKCQRCRRLIKQSKTKPRKYCEECAQEAEKENTRERVKRYREKCNENLTQQNDQKTPSKNLGEYQTLKKVVEFFLTDILNTLVFSYINIQQK